MVAFAHAGFRREAEMLEKDLIGLRKESERFLKMTAITIALRGLFKSEQVMMNRPIRRIQA